MALSGVVAISEPAFWAGYDRTPAGFIDYYRQLTETEPKRAAQFGIQHYSWMCLNPKEGEDRELAKEVLRRIPKFLQLPGVLGIGEIGTNRNTRNELATFHDHVQLALEHDVLIHIHTPHLEDKYKGTKLIVDALLQYPELKPERVLIDHAEEHTVDMILENGFWTGLTLYPQTKVSPERAIDLIETRGPDRICVASACDWGPSVPLAVPQFALAMRRRGHGDALIRRIVWDNPVRFLGQSPKFLLRSETATIASQPAPEGSHHTAGEAVVA
jgi:predicted metal-dependent TIM-barrel fold hydrolase